MTDSYRSLIKAFPAAVEITRNGEAVEFRLVGSLMAVRAELERIEQLCRGRAWLRTMGPTKWGEEWIICGVLRERGRLIPPEAQHGGILNRRRDGDITPLPKNEEGA